MSKTSDMPAIINRKKNDEQADPELEKKSVAGDEAVDELKDE
jgi:hypothetical protein